MLTISLRIGALCLVAACVVASSADAQHKGRGGGGGGGGGSVGRSMGGGGSIGRSMGGGGSIGRSMQSAPSFRSAPSVRHFSAPSARPNLTTRSLRQSTPHISRSEGISRSLRRGAIGSRNVTLQKGEKGLPNVARGKGTASDGRPVSNHSSKIETPRSRNRCCAIKRCWRIQGSSAT